MTGLKSNPFMNVLTNIQGMSPTHRHNPKPGPDPSSTRTQFGGQDVTNQCTVNVRKTKILTKTDRQLNIIKRIFDVKLPNIHDFIMFQTQLREGVTTRKRHMFRRIKPQVATTGVDDKTLFAVLFTNGEDSHNLSTLT
jgi:hypothetical protein